ncbi:MAG: hypothetical protein EP341_05415 [Sphingomonadales bacterium]|nr:MAG: hypothetical protein EP341_05415 [Sphingomonadales bacterium]
MLFAKNDLPRAKRVKRMHVADAGQLPGGSPGIRFECPYCRHDTGWIKDEWTISENRRGQPCPVCNWEIHLPWKQMGVMEPEWHEALSDRGTVQLHTDWAETEWVLADEDDVLMHTMTLDLVEAKKRAEHWLINNRP